MGDIKKWESEDKGVITKQEQTQRKLKEQRTWDKNYEQAKFGVERMWVGENLKGEIK